MKKAKPPYRRIGLFVIPEGAICKMCNKLDITKVIPLARARKTKRKTK